MFQIAFRIALPVLPYREPEIITDLKGLDRVFEKENIKSALIMTDKGIVNNGLVAPIEENLKNSGISYTVYDGTRPTLAAAFFKK